MRSLLKKRDPEFQPLSLKELVNQVAALVRAEIKMHYATFEIDLPNGLPPVRGDRVQLQQVLVNLLMNSLDALEDLPSERRRLSLTARAVDPQTVEVAVSDRGRGISADKLSDLFKPFSTTKPRGLGMGLAISQIIIAAHGGHIWAENHPAGGATLRFTLKIAEQGGAA
jgi:two-component system sensor kinase FixL